MGHVVVVRRPQRARRDHDVTRTGCDTSRVNDDDSGAERHINIHLSPEMMAGVYANFANVSHSDYEFTMTFARVDHEVEADEVPGVVVSRVNLSPRFMRELIDAMEDNYSKWRPARASRTCPSTAAARRRPDVHARVGRWMGPPTRWGRGWDGRSKNGPHASADDVEPTRPHVEHRDRSKTGRRRPPRRGTASDARCSYPATMKVAIISDIHGNRQAFEAVLEDIAASDATEVWCLGDLVGYGADPDACVDLAREHADVCLAGNHDLAVAGKLPARRLLARRRHRRALDPGGDRAPTTATSSPACAPGRRRRVGLYHASPRDQVWEYVLSALLAELCLDRQRDRVCLIGHSHVALSFVRLDGEPATGETAPRRQSSSTSRTANGC